MKIERQAAEQGGTLCTGNWKRLTRLPQRGSTQTIRKGFPGHWKFFISGKTLTELTQTSGDALPYQVHQFAIAPASRELLHQRIEQRFHQMLASDFEAEVRALLPVEICIRTCLPFVVWDTARCGRILKVRFHTMKWFIEVFAPRDS